jgi:uncharacterized integral membrane protein
VKIAFRILSFVIAVAVVVFALANRAPMTLSLSPLPVEQTLPTYLVILVTFAAGVAVGGLSHWFAAGGRRRAASKEHRQLVRVERELTEVRQHSPTSASTEADSKALETV